MFRVFKDDDDESLEIYWKIGYDLDVINILVPMDSAR